MGIGQAAGGALERINYALDWSNPLAKVLDECIKGALDQFGVDDLLEKVSGDNERLTEVAQEWRTAARDLRGVVEDLVAERRAVEQAWTGEAADGFTKTMTDFEEALRGEADDMDTIAELLEMAAEACAMAEEMMLEVIVEIVEAIIASAATTAVLAVLTAGAAAAIGPLVAAAGVATRVAKGVRITAKLADKLSDLAKRMQAMRKLAKLRRYLRTTKAKDIKKDLKGARGRMAGALIRGNMPDPTDLAKYMAWKQIKGISKGIIGVDPAGAVTGGLMENGPKVGEEAAEYAARPDSKSFDERMEESPEHAQKSVREAFG
ncbi:WXG100 family type VII secretion target [Streptomyces chattanoogensis]|uniref:WXG100 family type VII secretion target n=1 Tax=Streptomyces chattanoogensis TaxID=66876 RepID=UPI0036C59BF2